MRLSEILFYKLEKFFFGYQERPGTMAYFDLTSDHIKSAEAILKRSDKCTLHLYGRYNLKKMIKHFTRNGYQCDLLDDDVLTVYRGSAENDRGSKNDRGDNCETVTVN